MKVELIAGIKSISGATKNKKGKRLVFKTYRAASTSRTKPETRVYLQDQWQRSTAPSEAELAARQRFGEIARIVHAMADEEKRAYYQQWVADKYKFNGKKYATLRGYIMARLFNSHSDV